MSYSATIRPRPSCVHVAALLPTLMEVSQKSCTSLPCVWSRPKQSGSSIVARDLNFGRASFDGYKDISKLLPPALGDRDLLKVCDEAWFVTRIHSTLTQQTD